MISLAAGLFYRFWVLEVHQRVISTLFATPKDYMVAPRFPVKSKQFVATIQGLKTEVVQCGYDDHLMVIVAQIGKMGTLLYARKEEGYGTAPTFNVSILMGKRDEPLMVVCARQLIEQISKTGGSRPLILSVGLSDHSAETLKQLVEVVDDNKTW